MKRYLFKEGSPFNKKEAQVVGEYLELTFKETKVTPKAVVTVAEDPRSPLHKYFDWNNKTAAEKYRLLQARRLVNSLYIKIEDNEVRAYEHVYLRAVDQSSYVDIGTISTNKDLWEQVVEQAKRELLYWEAKYSLYEKHLPRIFSAIRLLKKEQANGKESKGRNRGTNSNSSNRGKGRGNYNSRRYSASSK